MRLDRRALLAAGVALAAGPAPAQTDYRPRVGQPGKDVIWVPTPDRLARYMLTLARTTSTDIVVDLGSGDGKIPIMAAREFGATARGVEYNPDLVALSERKARAAGVQDKARFVRGDIFQHNFTDATVVTLYLLETLNARLRPQLLRLRPGTRIVSHAFSLGEWLADVEINVDGRRAYLWVVPAPAAGLWRLAGAPPFAAGVMELQQTFQQAYGQVRIGERNGAVMETELVGADFSFALRDAAGVRWAVAARFEGDRLAGTATNPEGVTAPFLALREGPPGPMDGPPPA